LENKNNNNNTSGNLKNLIQLYLVAIDNKNKNEVKKIYNENKRATDENDIVFEIHNRKQLNIERLNFIINNCRNYLNISSHLVKELMKINYDKTYGGFDKIKFNRKLLKIILKYGVKFFDNEIVLKLLYYYKNKTQISDYDLNNQLDNDKYKVPLEPDDDAISRLLNGACKLRNEAMVNYLIEHGANLNENIYHDKTPIYDACLSGNENLVRYLIGLGADINKETDYGETPLFDACSSGNENLVRYLVELGADTNKENDWGKTPIFYACLSGSENLVRYLVGYGVEMNKKDKYGETPISYACESGNEHLVKYLLEQGANISEQNNYNGTPLLHACSEGRDNIVRYLVDIGVDINKGDNNNGVTPLFEACVHGHENIVKYLVEQGADVNKKNNNDYTPLYIACFWGQEI